MFDENQIVIVKWNSKIKNHYIERGYYFTKMGDEFEVKAKDLTSGSHVLVKCECDFCHKEYTMQYKTLITRKGKHACQRCQKHKQKETIKERYGVDNMSQIDNVKNKKMEKSLKKYGTKHTLQSKEVREKAKATMLKKYGVDYPAKSDEIKAKIAMSFYLNGTAPTSKPEKEMCNLLVEAFGKENCFPSYPVERVNLDCLLCIDDILIDCEYDGNYYHKDRKLYDNRRNGFLIKRGYKVLRILGNKNDTLPTIKEIKEAVDYLVHNHSIVYIDMNKQDEHIVCSHVKT